MARFAGLACLVLSIAAPGISGADTLTLRTDCGTPPASGCFTTLDDVLDELHNPTSPRTLPSASNPVSIDIGPGVFSLTSTANKYCDNLTNVSFRGAGKESTILTGGGFAAHSDLAGKTYAAWFENCTDVTVDSLTIRAVSPTAWSGAMFVGDGVIRWQEVRITAEGLAYYDQNSTDRFASEHFWYDCELIAASGEESPPTIYTIALYSVGATHWVHGSQLVAQGNIPLAVVGAGEFDLHIYGSRLSADGPAPTTVFLTTDQTHVPARNQCAVSKASIEGSALSAASPSGTAVNVNAVCGQAMIRGTRFASSGNIAARVAGAVNATDAPYEIGSGTAPPTTITSAWNVRKGQDTFVETDCSATKCDSGAALGTKHHILSFDASCNTAGPWFDTVTQNCRGI